MNNKKLKVFHYVLYAYLFVVVTIGPLLLGYDIVNSVASYYIPTGIVMMVLLIIYYRFKAKLKSDDKNTESE